MGATQSISNETVIRRFCLCSLTFCNKGVKFPNTKVLEGAESSAISARASALVGDEAKIDISEISVMVESDVAAASTSKDSFERILNGFGKRLIRVLGVGRTHAAGELVCVAPEFRMAKMMPKRSRSVMVNERFR